MLWRDVTFVAQGSGALCSFLLVEDIQTKEVPKKHPEFDDEKKIIMSRPNVAAELKRRVLCEAGHHCAIPTCRHFEVEIHHIIPWTKYKERDMKKIWIPQAIVIPLLLLALAFNPDDPYGYYIPLRWVCCATFVYLAFRALTLEKSGWVWILGVTALIYNPIFRVPGTRDMWSLINLAAIGFAVVSIFVLKHDENSNNEIEMDG